MNWSTACWSQPIKPVSTATAVSMARDCWISTQPPAQSAQPQLPLADSLDSGLVPLNQSSISTFGGALGNSLQSALGDHNMAVFDELGFPFIQSASALIGNSPTTLQNLGPAPQFRTARRRQQNSGRRSYRPLASQQQSRLLYRQPQ